MQDVCLLLHSDLQFEADMTPLADSHEGLINALWGVQSQFFAHMIMGFTNCKRYMQTYTWEKWIETENVICNAAF